MALLECRFIYIQEIAYKDNTRNNDTSYTLYFFLEWQIHTFHSHSFILKNLLLYIITQLLSTFTKRWTSWVVLSPKKRRGKKKDFKLRKLLLKLDYRFWEVGQKPPQAQNTFNRSIIREASGIIVHCVVLCSIGSGGSRE